MRKEYMSLLTAIAFVIHTAAVAGGADAPVPAEKNAQVSVLTGGESCTIYVDGQIAGDSPITIPIEPGKHHIQAVPFRGKSKEKTITIKEHENLEVQFDFPLPKPVKAAMHGNYGKDEGTGRLGLTTGDIAFGVCLVAIIGAAVIVANSGGSSSGSFSVENGTTTIDVQSDQPASSGDVIGVSVNGGNVNEFALDPAGVRFSVPLRAGANSITVHAISEGTVAGNSGTMTVQKPSGGMNVLRWDLPAGASQTFNVDVP